MICICSSREISGNEEDCDKIVNACATQRGSFFQFQLVVIMLQWKSSIADFLIFKEKKKKKILILCDSFSIFKYWKIEIQNIIYRNHLARPVEHMKAKFSLWATTLQLWICVIPFVLNVLHHKFPNMAAQKYCLWKFLKIQTIRTLNSSTLMGLY